MKDPNEEFVCMIALGGGMMYMMLRRNMFLRHHVERKMLLGGAWYVPQLERVHEFPLLGVAWAFSCNICSKETITNPRARDITITFINLERG